MAESTVISLIAFGKTYTLKCGVEELAVGIVGLHLFRSVNKLLCIRDVYVVFPIVRTVAKVATPPCV